MIVFVVAYTGKMGCRRRPLGVVRITLIAINILFVIAGLAVSALGIYLRVGNVDHTMWTHVVGNALIAYGTIAAGVIIVITAFCGFLGSINQNRCLLITYLTIIVIFVMAQIALGIFAIVENRNMHKYIEKAWRGLNDDTKFLLQERMQCCGLYNGSEWTQDRPPESCINSVMLTNASAAEATDGSMLIWNKSCSDSIMEYFADNMVYAISVAGGLLFIELMQITLACVVVRRINRRRSNEKDFDGQSFDSEAAFEEYMSKKIRSETFGE